MSFSLFFSSPHGTLYTPRVNLFPKFFHKLTADVLEFIEGKVKEGVPLRARKLAPLIKEKFGKEVHPRSIERAMERRKKKRK